MGDPTAFTYITPSELLKKHPDSEKSLEELKALAKQPDKECDCGMKVWKYGGMNMCFSCLTGESDASEDYELLPE